MKYVILDFGNVLAAPTSGKWFLTPKFYEEINIEELDMNKIHFNSIKANPYLSDKMVTLDDEIDSFIKYYKELLKDTGFENKAELIANDFVYKSDKYSLFSLVKKELGVLSKKYKIVLLTDNWPCANNALKDLEIDNYFYKVYISSVYKEVKKDGRFFDIMMNDLNIKDGEAVFVDDNDDILDVAASKGLKVYKMDRLSMIKNSKYSIINNLFDLVDKLKISI